MKRRWATSGCSRSTRQQPHRPGKDSNSDTDIRDAIAPLNQLADEHECMVFGVRHLSEKECSRGRPSLRSRLERLGASSPRAVACGRPRQRRPPRSRTFSASPATGSPPAPPAACSASKAFSCPSSGAEVTRAVWIGDSSKDVGTMLAKRRRRENRPERSRTRADPRHPRQPSHGWNPTSSNARIAKETGIKAKTVKNLRGELKDAGLIKRVPREGWRRHGPPLVRRPHTRASWRPNTDPDPGIFKPMIQIPTRQRSVRVLAQPRHITSQIAGDISGCG